MNINNANNESWIDYNKIHPELIASKKLIYDPCQFTCSNPIPEIESSEYGAYMFKLNFLNVKFRVAKITPTKIGQFVTLWKRCENKIIKPYDLNDEIDLFIVVARKGDNLGQFIFPKSVLHKYNIISMNNQGGKRAIRVYPPWDVTINKQAKKTQEWQLKYFLEIPNNNHINYKRVDNLYLQDSYNY